MSKKQEDLSEEWKKFLDKYKKVETKILENDVETKIVFLNGEFGWGKTYFFREILNINTKYIYSPWLEVIDEELTESIFNRMFERKKWTKIVLSSFVVFASIIVFISYFESTFTTTTNVLVLTYKNILNNTNHEILISNYEQMFLILLFGFILLLVYVAQKFSNFSLNDKRVISNKDVMFNIEKIINKVPRCLVFEDVDRMGREEIEYVFKVIKLMSDYIVENKIPKYIVISGDWNIITQNLERDTKQVGLMPNIHINHSKENFYYSKSFLEKIVEYKIDFISVQERVSNLLSSECYLNISTDSIFFDALQLVVNDYGITYRWLKRNIFYLIGNGERDLNIVNFFNNLNTKYYDDKGIQIVYKTKSKTSFQNKLIYSRDLYMADQESISRYNASYPLFSFLSPNKTVLSILEWEIIISEKVNPKLVNTESIPNMFVLHLLGIDYIQQTTLEELIIESKKNVLGMVTQILFVSLQVNYREISLYLLNSNNNTIGLINRVDTIEDIHQLNEAFNKAKEHLLQVFNTESSLRKNYPKMYKLLNSPKMFCIRVYNK